MNISFIFFIITTLLFFSFSLIKKKQYIALTVITLLFLLEILVRNNKESFISFPNYERHYLPNNLYLYRPKRWHSEIITPINEYEVIEPLPDTRVLYKPYSIIFFNNNVYIISNIFNDNSRLISYFDIDNLAPDGEEHKPVIHRHLIARDNRIATSIHKHSERWKVMEINNGKDQYYKESLDLLKNNNNRYCSSSISYKHLLFIVGGYDYHSKNPKISNVLSIYDKDWNIWYEKKLTESKINISVIENKGFVFFAGGYMGNNNALSYSDKVDIYNFNKGHYSSDSAWSQETLPSGGRSNISIGKVGNKILFVGGINHNGIVNTIDVFHMDKEGYSWSIITLPNILNSINLNLVSTDNVCFITKNYNYPFNTIYDKNLIKSFNNGVFRSFNIPSKKYIADSNCEEGEEECNSMPNKVDSESERNQSWLQKQLSKLGSIHKETKSKIKGTEHPIDIDKIKNMRGSFGVATMFNNDISNEYTKFLENYETYTVEFWFFMKSYNNNEWLFTNNCNRLCTNLIIHNHRIFPAFFLDGQLFTYTNGLTIHKNEWCSITFTYEKKSGKCNIYYNLNEKLEFDIRPKLSHNVKYNRGAIFKNLGNKIYFNKNQKWVNGYVCVIKFFNTILNYVRIHNNYHYLIDRFNAPDELLVKEDLDDSKTFICDGNIITPFTGFDSLSKGILFNILSINYNNNFLVYKANKLVKKAKYVLNEIHIIYDIKNKNWFTKNFDKEHNYHALFNNDKNIVASGIELTNLRKYIDIFDVEIPIEEEEEIIKPKFKMPLLCSRGQRLDNNKCIDCPIDTYSKKINSKNCIPCGPRKTTNNLIKQDKCIYEEDYFDHESGVYPSIELTNYITTSKNEYNKQKYTMNDNNLKLKNYNILMGNFLQQKTNNNK